MQIFVANESEKAVWFDDLQIKQTESLIVQEIHYDPWGLPLKGIERTNNYASKFLYQGYELEELGNLYTSEARLYEPTLGRFSAADPAAQFANPYMAIIQ